MSLVDQLFAALAVPWLPWLLALGILLLAQVLWWRFTARLAPLRRALARAIELVDQGEGTASFKQRFPAIFAGLAEDPVLGRGLACLRRYGDAGAGQRAGARCGQSTAVGVR